MYTLNERVMCCCNNWSVSCAMFVTPVYNVFIIHCALFTMHLKFCAFWDFFLTYTLNKRVIWCCNNLSVSCALFVTPVYNVSCSGCCIRVDGRLELLPRTQGAGDRAVTYYMLVGEIYICWLAIRTGSISGCIFRGAFLFQSARVSPSGPCKAFNSVVICLADPV